MNVINFTTDLQFENNEALASLSANPNVKWAKFIFTDDQPNANSQRVPVSEFENILKTGPLMPIKMASGIEDGHEWSKPIGVISQLKQEENKVLGLAALWIAEREDDINLLKDMTDGGRNPQLSWELWYSDSAKDDVTGITDLLGVTVRAATIVGKPAYKGRTPILAMSSDTSNDEKPTEEKSMDLEARIKELEDMLEQMKSLHDEEMAKMKDEVDKAKCSLDSASSVQSSMQEELDILRAFKKEVDDVKAEVEKAEAEAAKLEEIRSKFVSAGLEKTETYFSENREKLLGMEESVLEFLIQEMSAFAKASAAKASEEIRIPNLVGDVSLSTNPRELGRKLLERERNKTKEVK